MHVHVIGPHVLPANMVRHIAAVKRALPGARVTGRSVLESKSRPAAFGAQPVPVTTFDAPDNLGQFSGAYQWLAESMRARDPRLPMLVRSELGPGDGSDPDITLVAGWSAGGAFVRELARENLGPAWGLVCLDGSYARLGATGPGSAHPDDVASWVHHADLAATGLAVLAMGATSLDYVERLPAGAYASTRTVLSAVRHALEGLRAIGQGDVTRAGLRLDQHESADHVAAVTGWGVELSAWAAATCVRLLGLATTEPPPTEPAPTPVVVAPAGRPRGIDVSRAQGPGEQNMWDRWDEGKDAISFGAARCSSGVIVDPTFAGNWHCMREAELEAEIAYHYVNGRPAEQQLDAIAAAGVALLNATALDIEPWDPAGRVTPDWVAAMAADRCAVPLTLYDRLGDMTGRPPLVYSARWAIDCVPGLTAALVARGAEWWIADASAAARAAGHPVLGLPKGVTLDMVRIWQRGTRLAEGEPAPVDDDVWLGSLDSLRAWARG